MNSDLTEKKEALRSQEESMRSLRASEAELTGVVSDQRQYIQELQAKLMDQLREVGQRLHRLAQ